MQNRKTLDDMQSLDSTRSSVLVAVVVGVLLLWSSRSNELLLRLTHVTDDWWIVWKDFLPWNSPFGWARSFCMQIQICSHNMIHVWSVMYLELHATKRGWMKGTEGKKEGRKERDCLKAISSHECEFILLVVVEFLFVERNFNFVLFFFPLSR